MMGCSTATTLTLSVTTIPPKPTTLFYSISTSPTILIVSNIKKALPSVWVPTGTRFSRALTSVFNKPNWAEAEVVNTSREYENDEFVVVNFYRFVFINDPESEISKQLSFLQGRDIHGRIYLNEQGINAQYSGPSKDACAYVKWLEEDYRFSDILFQISPAPNGHAFPRLKLR